MERTTKSLKVGNSDFEVASWTFTEEERTKIEDALEKYEPDLPELKDAPEQDAERIRQELIDHFIMNLEALCDFFNSTLRENRTSGSHHYEELFSLFELLNQAQRKLLALQENRFFAPRVFDVDDLFNHNFLISGAVQKKLVVLAGEAREPLVEILDLLHFAMSQEQNRGKAKTGKPTADRETKLIENLAKLYKTYLFAIPKTYLDGPFALVVKAVLEILDLPSIDPHRQIRKAVKSLQS